MFKKILMSAAAASLVLASGAAIAGDYGHGQDDHSHEAEAMEVGTIVDVAAGNEDFSTLVAAVKAAGLVDALSGEGPLTVFAPTNAAFEKLPEGTVEDLLKPENKDKLTAVLTYHVVGGKIKAGDIAEGSTDVETLQGTTATVTKSEDGVKIDEANVVTADVKASNGVIHVIDTVIMP